jgi:RNA polymerase-binding protein DksA
MAKKKRAKPAARKKAPAKTSTPAGRGKAPARSKPPAPKARTASGKPAPPSAKGPLAKARAAPPERGQVEPRTEPRQAKAVRAPSRRIKAADLHKIRQLLAQKKVALTNHLQTELSELEKPEKRHRTDLEEIASDTHDTDSLCEIMDIEATQIGQIDLALAKIDNGTYGVCEDCGGEIPLVRLQALPFATQCIECKRKAEIQGQIASDSRLG